MPGKTDPVKKDGSKPNSDQNKKKDPVKKDGNKPNSDQNKRRDRSKKADNKNKNKKDPVKDIDQPVKVEIDEDPVKKADNNNPKNKQKKNQNNSKNKQQKDKKNKVKAVQLPDFITFKKKQIENTKNNYLEWPQNKTFVVDMYPRSKVPVTFINSEDTEILEQHLSNHRQDIVVIVFEMSNNLIEICTKKGVLIIQDNTKSPIIREFIKTTPFFAMNTNNVKLLMKDEQVEFTPIKETYLVPKNYPLNIELLVRQFYDEPNYDFTKKTKGINCKNILYFALYVASIFIVLPMIQNAPAIIKDAKYIERSLQPFKRYKYNFYENEPTYITLFSDDESSQCLLPFIIKELCDDKAFVIGSFKEFYGYGTSKGILITKEQINPFNHASIPISEESIDVKLLEKYTKKTKENINNFLQLAIEICCTIKANQERPVDTYKENAKPPNYTKFRPLRFDIPSDIPIKMTNINITILPLSINPDLYTHFAFPAIESIRTIQELGFDIQQTHSFDIDEMYECIRNSEISDDIEIKIKELFDSFPKTKAQDVINILEDIEPKGNEKDAYIRIIESSDFKSLSEDDVNHLLKMLNRVCLDRSKYIDELCSLNDERKAEINSIMSEIFVSIQPSDDLVDRIKDILAKEDKTFEKFTEQFNKVLELLETINIEQNDKEKLIDLFNKTVSNLSVFASKQRDCFNQVELIKKALINLKVFNQNSATPEETNLFISNATKMMDAVDIYIKFMNSQDNQSIRTIENLLFNLIFQPSDGDSPLTQVYAVYQMHNPFLFDESPFVNFKSSTGSGKTRCAPFFFSIKALMDNMTRPFFIMTQPGASIISDKMKDFKKVLGEKNVILVQRINEMIKLYKNQNQPSKPVVALFSPHNALRLLTEAEKEGIDIISKTRFCLDEIHERSVDTDVFIAKLSEKMRSQQTFPLQVLMMSATPDARVLNCFGQVNTLELPDSQLFPITTIQKEVSSKNNVSNEAAIQTIEILKQMAHGEKQLGHILVFTSGNARINEFVQKVSDHIKEARTSLLKEIEQMSKKIIEIDSESDDDDLDDNNNNIIYKKMQSKVDVPVIRNLRFVKDITLDDKYKFDKKLDEITKGDDTSLFIIPIKFAGFVSNDQKEIAKNVIKKHENVIKIIVATNAIESSITIDQLSAVVDCGVFNQPQFDTQRGLTKLSEEPISIQSQTQRKGRVGRVRPGISVQISIKGCSFKKFLPPEIQTTDISSNILSLRKIGIKLETIKNLPDPIDPQSLHQFMDELYGIGAIDKNSGELTEIGEKISKFETLSPFLAASIMNAAATNSEKAALLEILGSLIVLIFNSSDLIIDVFAEPLQNNFNEDSDIITILKTFLDLICEKSWKLKANKFGFNSKSAQGILSAINSITENLQISTNETTIFKQLKEVANEIDLMEFIQSIINNIESYKNTWIQCRKASFMTIDNISTNPSIYYIGDKSLKFDDDEAQSEIMLTTRPGSKGLISPGAAYIFDISHNESMSINFGSCIHRNLKEDPINGDDSYNFIKPRTLERDISLYAQEEFTTCLLNSILRGREKEFRSFNNKRHTGLQSGKNIFYISIFKGKTVFTYAPMNKDSDEAFKDAVNKITSLLPYAPSTILVKHPLLHCAISLRFVTIDKQDSTIYFFKENDCYPYQINKEILEYLANDIKQLSSIENQTYIAITGEDLSIPLESNDSFDFIHKSRPNVDPKCNYVFSEDPAFFNHMIVISKNPIPGQTPIPWTKAGIYADYAPKDYITKVANGIFPDLIRITECERRIFFFSDNKNNVIKITGKFPTIEGGDELLSDYTSLRSIETMFDRFAMGCAAGNKLICDVDLRSFDFNGIRLPYIFSHENELKKFIITNTREAVEAAINQSLNQNPQLKELIDRKDELEKRKSEIISRNNELNHLWDTNGLPRTDIINEQRSIKSERAEIDSQLLSIKAEIDKLKRQKPKQKDSQLEKILQIQSLEYYDTAVNLSQKNFSIHFVNQKRVVALSLPTNLSEQDKTNNINSFLEALKPAYPHQSFRHEDIPLYKITITHPKNSPLNQEEFTEKILGVCKRFGAIISHISHYCETNKGKNPNVNGFIFVYMYSAVFTIPFASLAAEAMFGNDFSVLKIPTQLNIDPITLAKDRKMLNIMKNWLAENDLDIQLSKNKWVGPQKDVNKASELFKSSPPAFPTKFISIPGGVDLIRLNTELKRLSKAGKKKWSLNFITKTITVPSDTDDEKVKSFIDSYKQIGGANPDNDDDDFDDDELEYIGDVSYCGNDSLSTKLVNVYKDGGIVQTKNFCKNCIRDSLLSSLGRMYDDENDIPIMNRIFDNINYINPITLLFSEEGNPIIPIGQLIEAFIQDANIATPAKSYVTALALQTLKKSPYVTCCPDHPTILYRKPQRGIPLKCIISGCNHLLCNDCYKWHKPGNCPEKILVPRGCRVCPNCGAIVEKSEACNKLSCNCGKIFCYYCGAGPYNDCGACYSHLSEKHKGCFNDPPDYRKFIKKDSSVTDKELEDFYCKYENLRNLKA